MIRKQTLSFLKQLQKNNLKSWVDEHRAECDAAKDDFAAVARWLIKEVSAFDPLVARARLTPARSMTRLNRDTRFHQGLPSYKTEIYCVANHRGRKAPTAAYFVRIAADGCAVGGGVLAPRAPDLKRYRERVSGYHGELREIIAAPAFRRACPAGLYDEGRLKKTPKDFDVDDPAADLLRFKHFTTFERLPDALATGPKAEARMREVVRASRPLVEFMNARD